MKVAKNGDRNMDHVALTFDDGPNPYATLKILNLLSKFNVKATFFLIGKRCTAYPELVQQIQAGGHLIGNHTFSHIIGDFGACNTVVESIVNISPVYIRPPFFNLSFCELERESLEEKIIVTGDVDSKDYLNISAGAVGDNVLSQVTSGSIIDFHDGSEIDEDLKTRALKTVEALDYIIPELIGRFHLVRLDQMSLVLESF